MSAAYTQVLTVLLKTILSVGIMLVHECKIDKDFVSYSCSPFAVVFVWLASVLHFLLLGTSLLTLNHGKHGNHGNTLHVEKMCYNTSNRSWLTSLGLIREKLGDLILSHSIRCTICVVYLT